MTLNENFYLAQKRYQPYINLVNEIHSIEELTTDTILKEIKSLYFRAETITLNQQLTNNLNKLIATGIKEILIFCDKNKSQLSSSKLNGFLKENSININFKVAQISEKDIERIREDEIGQKDLLGFSTFKNYQFTYKNGFIVDLLNNKETDEIILANHAQHRKYTAEKHTFTLTEPEYITENEGNIIVKRDKTYSRKTLGVNLEVTKNIDVKAEVNKETEEENELDLDQDQADNIRGCPR